MGKKDSDILILMRIDATAELYEILKEYDLGELVDYEKNERGYINTSYAIQTQFGGRNRKYFLRRYKSGIKEEEIQFEHAVIQALAAQGSLPVAGIFNTRQGQTYLKRLVGSQEVFYAIFEFLPGEDKYTWVETHCMDQELREAARVFAQFHAAVSDLQPRGHRAEAKILDLLPEIAQNMALVEEKNRHTPCDAFLLENRALILDEIEQVTEILHRPESLSLPQVVIHCDYHPGNLKFQGERVTALFDFDWSKIDYRCLDVGLALFYFFAEWGGEQDGSLRLTQLRLFLETYQETMRAAGGVGPLSPAELATLPAMIRAGNLFVLYWAIRDYYGKAADPAEYLGYLRHGVNLIEWIRNKGNLNRLAKAIV